MNHENQVIYNLISSLVITCLTVVSLFLWQGDKGLSLTDESFLWYGVQRVLAGEVPIRDFQSYDPGRYYWTAGIVKIIGYDDIISIRVAATLFQLIGLFIGIFLVSQSISNKKNNHIYKFLFMIIVSCTFSAWMYPRWKFFDISLSLVLVGSHAFLVQHPISIRYFIVGVCVGLAAFFGRNHGVYGAVGSMLVMYWLTLKNINMPSVLKGAAFWVTGVVVGYLPMLGMLLWVPGFAAAFWEELSLLLTRKATNLPLSVPWPWTVDLTNGFFTSEASRQIVTGIFFLSLPLFAIIAGGWCVRQKLRHHSVAPTLVASAALAFPYMHYAFSRADLGHLCHSIFPLLVGVFTILASARGYMKWGGGLLCVVSLWVMLPVHPGWQCLKSGEWVSEENTGLILPPNMAKSLNLWRGLTKDCKQQSCLIVPDPGYYAVFRLKSPIWENYILLPRPASFEEKEIKSIKSVQPRYIFIFNFFSEHDLQRFSNNRKFIYQYINNNYIKVINNKTPDYDFIVFKKQ